MDAKELIKRLPAAVRARLEQYSEQSAVLEPSSGEDFFEWCEHAAEIDGYIRALVDAGIILEVGAQMLEKYCRNEEADDH